MGFVVVGAMETVGLFVVVGLLLVLGDAVNDGAKVGRITGVVTTLEEQEGVAEFGIG